MRAARVSEKNTTNKIKRTITMKKNVKSILAGLAAAALLAGFSSCSNGSSDDTLTNTNSTGTTGTTGTTPGQTEKSTDDVFSGDEITYVINVASKDNENTKLILQYDRSAAGAKELISLTDAELSLTINGEAVTTPSTITFALDEYSSFEKAAGQKEEDESKQKQYKCKIDLNKQLSVNDTVKLQLKKAKVTGEGASTVKLGSIVATIVDTAEAANWWTELSETKYQPVITKKNGGDLNATTVVEDPATTTTPAADPATATPSTTPSTTPTADPAPAATTPTITYSESILTSIQKGDNVWGSGTNITGDAAPYTVTPGTGWDANGMASIPLCCGSLEGFNYIIITIDTAQFNFRADSAEYPSFELKIEDPEVKEGDTVTHAGKSQIFNATSCGNNGVYTVSISGLTFPTEVKQICLNLP